MRPGSTRLPQGQRSRPAAPPPSPPPATSIPIPYYPSSLRPPISQQSQNPPPNPAPTAPSPPPPPTPTRPRQHQATRVHVKVQQRFALPAELRAVLQCMPPPKKPRLVAPIRRSASGDEDRGGDRKRRRPASPSVSHLPVSKPPCAAVPQDVGHLENAMARISLSLQEIQQELRSQKHFPHPAAAPAPPLTLNDTGTAPSYRVISTATLAPPSLLKERVIKCRTNSSSSSNQNYNKSRSSKGGGPRFTVRNAGGTELVLDGGVEGRMVEILVGDFTGGCRTSQEEEKVRWPSISSPLPKVVTCAATTQDACTSPSVSLLTQGSDEMCESEESSVASVASSVWFQHRGALQQRASPFFSSCSSLELPLQRPSSDEVDDDNDDVHSFSVAAPTDLSLASLPLEWPVPAPSPLPSQSSHCFSSRESCFSPFVPERQHAEERREEVSTHEEEQEEKDESISGTVDISVRTNSRCSSCCDCFSVVAVASGGEEEEEGYNSDSSRSSSCSSYSSSSSSSSSSFCSSSSSTISISSCCHTVRERNTAFTTTPTLPVRLLRW